MPEIKLKETISTNGLYARHKEQVDRLLKKYPIRQSALLPVLWIIQEEDGWISTETMVEAAEICRCTLAQVMEVVSFYQMYNRRPVGKYVLGICGTLPCALCASGGPYPERRRRARVPGVFPAPGCRPARSQAQ